MLAFDLAIFSRDRVAFDRAPTSRTFDAYGRMHVQNCRISKANVCPYYGREIPEFQKLGLDANRIYMLYRDPVELEKGAASFANSQLLMKHAKVHAQDPREDLTVGVIGSNISFDGKYLVADKLTVWSHHGINLIETDEAKELSSSYRYRADMTPGVSPEGIAYDGVMRDIKANHVALVREGRAGHDVLVNDELPLELPKMKHSVLINAMTRFLKEDADKVALDAMLGESALCADEDMEDDPENPGKKRKKINPGKGQPMQAGGALASDEQIDAAVSARLKAGGFISKTDAEQLANDAAARASTEAVTRIEALHNAREAVKPLVGPVALDSAEAVYRYALEQEKVALDGVHPSAFGALVRERIALKSSAPVFPKTRIAPDAANAAAAALPGLGSIQVM